LKIPLFRRIFLPCNYIHCGTFVSYQ